MYNPGQSEHYQAARKISSVVILSARTEDSRRGEAKNLSSI